jgi:hypothetical protein
MSRASNYDASGRWSLPQDGEIIPAIRPAPRFMTMREPVALVNCEPTGKTTVRYDNSTGELSVITFQEALPSESSLKYLLAEERAKHPVRRLTFVSSNVRAEQHIHWLKKKGFERSASKYCGGSLISFSKDYKVKL